MKRGVILAAVGVVALLLAALAWRALSPRPADADVLSGYVEGEALYLAAPVSAVLTSITATEGEQVAAGVPLFTVDDRPLLAQQGQAQARIAASQAQARAARVSLDQQTANLAAAQAQADNAARDAARYDVLAHSGSGAVSAQEADRARTAARDTAARRQAAADQVRGARAQITAADADLAQAHAALDEVQSRLGQLSVRAPQPGRIEQVFFQSGEWAAANQPILSLIPDGRVRLRFFVPEPEASLYRPGGAVRFSCDACRGQPAARIVYVSPRPEYTPPIIYSRKARDRLVFLVEARPDDPRGLNPGQPVDVIPLGHATAARP